MKVYQAPTGARFQSYVKAKEYWELVGNVAVKGKALPRMSAKQAGLTQQHKRAMQTANGGPRDILPGASLEDIALWLRGVARTTNFRESFVDSFMRRSLLNARAALSLKRPGQSVL